MVRVNKQNTSGGAGASQPAGSDFLAELKPLFAELRSTVRSIRTRPTVFEAMGEPRIERRDDVDYLVVPLNLSVVTRLNAAGTPKRDIEDAITHRLDIFCEEQGIAVTMKIAFPVESDNVKMRSGGYSKH